ncbi:ABC transporter ATP-binding protein [Gordonia jinhuaensis]|uniref:Peptide ABC transporter ATP-binding protein n=2 Tax=Gordonia jinhuaensis TaxID=1517702 RepID=A0A916WW06_9ACTN|nr:peptide ABC transporter ATP-binding protein [Gordonia jinhuaensis]
MRVGKQIREIMVAHGGDRKTLDTRTVELLSSVAIPDPAVASRAYPHQMSGGQRQRVMLAMAMANDPDLLLADEPTTALDVTVARQVLELVAKKVEQSQSSLLFVSHDLGVVSTLCERVVIMRNGRVVEQGTVDRVFTSPEHPYTRALLAASSLVSNADTGRLVTVADMENRKVDTGGTGTSVVTGPVQGTTGDSGQEAQDRRIEKTSPHDVLVDSETASVVFNSAGAGSDQAAIVQVSELSRTYGGRRGVFGGERRVEALRSVSFDVHSGERFGIVGESGSGKSTLLRLLCALDTPTSGSVRVNGKEVAGVPERMLSGLRASMQIVFQDPMSSLDSRMRIRDVVAEPIREGSREEKRARVRELLNQVGLPSDAESRYPHEFSGGQRQRIAIARALSTRPRMLIADEAVSALDVSVRAQVLNLISDLVDEYQLTLIFVSHDLNVIRHTCDTVAVMHAGQIVECGPTEDVYSHPLHPYTQKLIAALPPLPSAGRGNRQPIGELA